MPWILLLLLGGGYLLYRNHDEQFTYKGIRYAIGKPGTSGLGGFFSEGSWPVYVYWGTAEGQTAYSAAANHDAAIAKAKEIIDTGFGKPQ